jgi:predicted kinase
MLLLRSGRTVIADAVFGSRAEQEQIAAVAALHGLPFRGVWLEGDPDTLAQRISTRVGDASDATVEVLNAQLLTLERPPGWHRLDVGQRSTEAARAELVQLTDER